MKCVPILWFCALVWTGTLASEPISPQGTVDELKVFVCESDAHRTLEIRRVTTVEGQTFNRLELKLPWGQYEEGAGPASP